MNAMLLYPKDYAQFRLGEGSLDESGEMLHSDTLFSALANIYALAFDKADYFIGLAENDKIRFSSGLFGLEFVAEQKRVFFVPKPELKYETDEEYRKKAKKIQFVSLGALKAISEIRSGDSAKINFNDFSFIGSKFLATKDEMMNYDFENEKFISVLTAPKVFVRKEVKEDAFYHESNLQFIPIQNDEGKTLAFGFFYVLLEHQLNETEFQEFQAAVRILADEGIGGSRSTGCGHIEQVKFEEITLNATGNSHLGLSLVSPKDDAEFKAAKQYDLVIRGGGSMGAFGDYKKHRKRARFIREGAIFDSEIKGRLVDVSPDDNTLQHKVWRNGINFSIPF